MFDILHVANGNGTTRLIEQAHLPGRTSIWADPLHEGPIVDADDDELIRIRAAAIAGIGDGGLPQGTLSLHS